MDMEVAFIGLGQMAQAREDLQGHHSGLSPVGAFVFQ
jgi:hypothetical protein